MVAKRRPINYHKDGEVCKNNEDYLAGLQKAEHRRAEDKTDWLINITGAYMVTSIFKGYLQKLDSQSNYY